MRQNAFGGRAPPEPAGEAWALPQTPSHNWGCLLLSGGGKGMGIEKEGDGKEEGRKGKGGEGEEGKDDLHPTLFLGPA